MFNSLDVGTTKLVQQAYQEKLKWVLYWTLNNDDITDSLKYQISFDQKEMH